MLWVDFDKMLVYNAQQFADAAREIGVLLCNDNFVVLNDGTVLRDWTSKYF